MTEEEEQEEMIRLRAENMALRQQIAAMSQRANLYRFGAGTARQSGDHIQRQIYPPPAQAGRYGDDLIQANGKPRNAIDPSRDL